MIKDIAVKMYKIILFSVFIIGICSCSKNNEPVQHITYKDGVYKAFSSIKDDWGGTAEVEIHIKNNQITECIFISYEKNGNVKGSEYGKVDGVIKNMGLYKIAQASVLRSAEYGKKLNEVQNIDKVDAISGATVSYKLFKDAVEIALQNAIEQE